MRRKEEERDVYNKLFKKREEDEEIQSERNEE